LSEGRHENVLGGCKGCHDAPKNEIRLATGMFKHSDYLSRGVTCENCHSDAIKGDGAVPKQTCWNCHNQPTQIARLWRHTILARFACQPAQGRMRQLPREDRAQPDRLARAAAELMQISKAPVAEAATSKCTAGRANSYRGVGGRGRAGNAQPDVAGTGRLHRMS
jgi:hypothetical protein